MLECGDVWQLLCREGCEHMSRSVQAVRLVTTATSRRTERPPKNNHRFSGPKPDEGERATSARARSIGSRSRRSPARIYHAVLPYRATNHFETANASESPEPSARSWIELARVRQITVFLANGPPCWSRATAARRGRSRAPRSKPFDTLEPPAGVMPVRRIVDGEQAPVTVPKKKASTGAPVRSIVSDRFPHRVASGVHLRGCGAGVRRAREPTSGPRCSTPDRARRAATRCSCAPRTSVSSRSSSSHHVRRVVAGG